MREPESWHRLFASLTTERVEVAAFAYLDADWRLLGVRHVRSAHCRWVDVPIREVARDALAFDATGVVMAHNHPSGSLTFSPEDLAISRRLARVLEALSVQLIDHLLLTRDAATSLRDLALI